MKKILFVLLFCFTSQAQVGTNNEIFNFPLDCNVMLDRVRSAEERLASFLMISRQFCSC